MGIRQSKHCRGKNEPKLKGSNEQLFIFVSNDPKKVKDHSGKPNTISCGPKDSYLKDYKFHTFEALEDSPNSDTIYIVHPHDKNEYIPLDNYRDIVFKEKATEFIELMRRLGAMEIEYNFKAGREGRKEKGGEVSVPQIGGLGIRNEKSSAQTVAKSERIVFDEPDIVCLLRKTNGGTNNVFFDLDKITAGLKFYEHQDDWKQFVKLRSKSWVHEINVKIESRVSKEYTIAAEIFAIGGSIGANSTAARAHEGVEEYKVTFFSERDYLKEEIYNKVNKVKGKQINYTAMLGKELKIGTIHAQDTFEEWVNCSVVVRERGLTLAFHSKGKERGNTVDDVIEFSSFEDVVIDMLPDNARRSRESKLFPFAVRRKNKEIQKTESAASRFENGSVKADAVRSEVILAVLNGKEMWEWASTIKWLGKIPVEKKVPFVSKPIMTSSHNEHYEDPQVLQDALLKMFTYKNLPKKPVTYDQIYNYWGNHYYWSKDSELGPDLPPNTTTTLIQNSDCLFGTFAFNVLIGACVQVVEKCFELITSSNLYDISSQGAYTKCGNSIMSMLCEGDYSTSRGYMVNSLFSQGYPKLEGYHAGSAYYTYSFSTLLAKPALNIIIGSPAGQPVHPDDQKLCLLLRDNGDGKKENKTLSEALIEASNEKDESFTCERNNFITGIYIPKRVLSWGLSHLKILNLSRNGIFELPDELFTFTNLTHLDVSSNCLFGISHKLGSLVNLESLNIQINLITELPYTISQLGKITEFACNENPITKPPSAIWSRGIADIRSFFKDMEGGTETNVDLRVLVLGLSEVGKTSLINGLIDPSTTSMTRVGDRTVGIEKRTWVLDRSEKQVLNQPKNQQDVNLLVYDFAGQEEYYITHHLFLGNRALYILAFDLSKYTFDRLDRQILLWWTSIQNRVCNVKSQDSKTPKVIIVGTKADLVEDAQGRADHIQEVLEKRFGLQLKCAEKRLKLLGKKLDQLDPRRKTGQANNDADKKRREQEYNSLPDATKIRIKLKTSEEEKQCHQIQCAIAMPKKIHAISSKDLSNFDQFKEQIASSLTEVGPSGKYFPQLDEQLPSSWFKVRKFIRDQSTRKGRECMKLPKYFQLLSDELGINEDVGLRATRFCHELGDVLFFEKEDLVFLQPSFLIEVFKLVIRHDHKESTYWREEMMESIDINEKSFNVGKELLLQGELEEWLLNVLWSQLDGYSDSNIKNNLIQLLETFDIATAIKHKSQERLLIPEFQPKSLRLAWSKSKEEGRFDAQRWICASYNLPYGLLKRIQIRVIKTIFKRRGTQGFKLAQNEFYIVDTNSTTLYCTSGQGSDDCPGFGIPEGIMLYVRGKDKERVMKLLTEVHQCVEDTLKDFPGMLFDHYAVHVFKNGGTSFIPLEELRQKQSTSKTIINVIPEQITVDGKKGGNDDSMNFLPMTSLSENVEIENLLRAPESLRFTFIKGVSAVIAQNKMKSQPMSTADQKSSAINNRMDNKSLVPHVVDNRQNVMTSSSTPCHKDGFSVDRIIGKQKKNTPQSPPTVDDMRRTMEMSITSSCKGRLSVARDLGEKNESEQTLSLLFEKLGIELDACKRMMIVLNKEGCYSNKDLIEILDGRIENLDYIFGAEAENFLRGDKLKILTWLKKTRSA